MFVFELVSTLAIVVAAFIGVFQNMRVFRYRGRVVNRTSALANIDIDKGNYDSWRQRYDLFDKVSYFEMVFKFWRSFDSFYPEEIRPVK